MQIPIRSNQRNNKLASQEKSEEREIWRKLVVKVILWKDKASEKKSNTPDKITPKEWKTYCQKMVETNVSYGKEKVMGTLKETWQIINNHGGFK